MSGILWIIASLVTACLLISAALLALMYLIDYEDEEGD